MLYLKSQIISCLHFDIKRPFFYEVMIVIFFLLMSLFDKILKKQSFYVVPHPNFLKFCL